jgi:hypothetical protein
MVNMTNDLDPNSFYAIFSNYWRLMMANNGAIQLSEDLRMFVAEFPSEKRNHHYTDHTMQDAFFFFTDLFGKWPQQLRNLFKILQSYRNICSGCQTTTVIRNRKTTFINIHLSTNNGVTNFMDLFTSTAMLNCDSCQKETLHTCRDFWSFPFENKFVILYIHNFNNQQKRIKSILTGYAHDHVVFPHYSDELSESFSIRAAIVREGETPLAGHFYLIVRSSCNSYWLRVNDIESEDNERVSQ